MNNYNQSTYYRANPYYKNNYLPPIANKNRNQPNFLVELPQGRQYFEPTEKKHYYMNYPFTHDIVKSRIYNCSPKEAQSQQKSYFRSLNAEDIQGAVPGTLISKAVKNKARARDQLVKRKQQEEEERRRQLKSKRLRQQEHELILSRYQTNPEDQINKLKINYHELMKQRNEGIQKHRLMTQEQNKKQTIQKQLMIPGKKPQKTGEQQMFSKFEERYSENRNLKNLERFSQREPLRQHSEEITTSPPPKQHKNITNSSQDLFEKFPLKKDFITRQQLRKYNPTFLSYGVPTVVVD